jgi:O-antigen/teichoic acid export membrane protein
VGKVKKGVIWSAIEKFSVQGIQFCISLILARLLLPSDFGLMAIILVILNVLQTINEVGFGAALIYKQDRDDLDFSSVFLLNIFLGIILYLILFFVSPFFSFYFDKPELTLMSRYIGVSLIINSFIVVQRTKLIINVDFKTQAKASLIAIIISGIIGIAMAYNGYGILSLVIQFILYSLINVILIWKMVGWRPSIRFSYKRFLFLFRFAYKLILSRLINTIFEQLYSIIIGKSFGFSQLGFFNRGQSFIKLSSNNLTTIVQRVSTPLLCEKQNDFKEMGELLKKFIYSTAMIVYPILFGLFVLAKPLIVFLLTEKWLGSVYVLKVLCPVGLLYVISAFNRNVFNATGRTDMALKTEIIKKTIFIIIVIFSAQLGFNIFLYSLVLIAVIEFLIDIYCTKKQIGLTLFDQLDSVKEIFISSICMSIIMFFSIYFIENYFLKLVVGSFTGFLSYVFMCYIFDIGKIRSVIKNLKMFNI